MATELLLYKVNYDWRKAGSAAGFALLEAVLVTRKQECIRAKRGGKLLYLQ